MEINLGQTPFDLDFHPSDSLLTTALIDGHLHLYRYGADLELQRVLDIHAHENASCRAARFIHDGHAIVTGSSERAIRGFDVETGATIAHRENAHKAPIYRIIKLDDSTIASGDDEGCVKVWDTRQQSCCSTFNVHSDYISDMAFVSESMRLLVTSGDGTLSVYGLRSNKVQAQSEFSEEELRSVVVMKNGRKVVCGTQSGPLLLYSWGFFKDCSDRFVGSARNGVENLLKVDEDRVLTGSSNGLISLVGILPNRIIQPIAVHSGYPIEGLALSHDKRFLGSIAHDTMLKLWDMDPFLQASSSVMRGDAAATCGGDTDRMDFDTDLANFSRGTKRSDASNGQASSSSFGSFFADL